MWGVEISGPMESIHNTCSKVIFVLTRGHWKGPKFNGTGRLHRVHAQSFQLCLTLCNPMDCSLPRPLCPWDSPGKKTGVGCHFLLQGSSPPRDRTRVSCTAGGVSTTEPLGSPLNSEESLKLSGIADCQPLPKFPSSPDPGQKVLHIICIALEHVRWSTSRRPQAN